MEKWEISTLNGENREIYGPYKDQSEAQINFDRTIDPSSVTPEDEYEAAILKGSIYFAQNYGWVDATHAFTDTKRVDITVGIDKLWNKINGISNSQTFSLITYKQDILLAGTISIGASRTYWVRSGLSLQEKREVALAIVQDVSIAFESLQGIHPTSGSSFEPADLPSNMLSYYRTVFPELDRRRIEGLIRPLPEVSSLRVYRRYPGTFSDSKYKNRSFDPKYFWSIYTAQSYSIPEVLKSVRPSTIKQAPFNGPTNMEGNVFRYSLRFPKN